MAHWYGDLMGASAYLNRIGLVREELPADLDSLRRIVAAHAEAIPFENLDQATGHAINLDRDAVFAKLVDGPNRRGGYCFEHSTILSEVLPKLGFSAFTTLGRVFLNYSGGANPPAATHLVTLVDLPEGRFIADVGLGGTTPTAPIPLRYGEFDTPHDLHRLVTADDSGIAPEHRRGLTHFLQFWKGDHGGSGDQDAADRDSALHGSGEWVTQYGIGETPALAIDIAVGNWWVSTSPSSHFVTGLVAARVDGSVRRSLSGTTVRSRDYATNPPLSTSRELADIADLRATLSDLFGIDTGGVDLEAAWARATGQ